MSRTPPTVQSLEEEFGVQIHQWMKRHPRFDEYWFDLVAVRDDVVVAWATKRSERTALMFLRASLWGLMYEMV